MRFLERYFPRRGESGGKGAEAQPDTRHDAKSALGEAMPSRARSPSQCHDVDTSGWALSDTGPLGEAIGDVISRRNTGHLVERVGAVMDLIAAVEAKDPGAVHDAWDDLCSRCRLKPGVRPEPPVERMLQAALHARLSQHPEAMRVFLVHLHRELRGRAAGLAQKATTASGGEGALTGGEDTPWPPALRLAEDAKLPTLEQLLSGDRASTSSGDAHQ